MIFSVTSLPNIVRIYQLRYPLYSPSLLCTTNLHDEYTVYKYTGKDDGIFESLSIQYDPRNYHVYSIHEDCPGLSHIGIVHYLSGLISKENIPILYVNTYGSNLVFVSDEYNENAVSIMKSHSNILFVVEELSNSKSMVDPIHFP